VDALRRAAASSVYRPKVDLAGAIERLGFVQADPIRVPATAQDLILRHRARDYRAGDLERHYASLAIEEEYLYAYGFIPRGVRALIHPRKVRPMSKLEKTVLAKVRERGHAHPRDFEAKRVVNAWGGFSKATTRALDALHHMGHLRVARRERGIRVYSATPPFDVLDDEARLRGLIVLVATVLAPISERTLRGATARYKWLGDPKTEIQKLVKSGELAAETVDNVRYVWPARMRALEEIPSEVRLLAPFDPVVWDRRRFEHLWGWAYRFEAYTPIAKRVRGYYALPLLFRDRVIGWANVDGDDVETGFASKRPGDATFRRELDAEIERLRAFLNAS
jgi:uncharacterized protein YcaQ